MSAEAYGGFIFKCSDAKEARNLLDDLADKNTCSVTMDNKVLGVGIVELCLLALDDDNIAYCIITRPFRE